MGVIRDPQVVDGSQKEGDRTWEGTGIRRLAVAVPELLGEFMDEFGFPWHRMVLADVPPFALIEGIA